ncbi:unnamed protein product [Arctogadus glacialis]
MAMYLDILSFSLSMLTKRLCSHLASPFILGDSPSCRLGTWKYVAACRRLIAPTYFNASSELTCSEPSTRDGIPQGHVAASDVWHFPHIPPVEPWKLTDRQTAARPAKPFRANRLSSPFGESIDSQPNMTDLPSFKSPKAQQGLSRCIQQLASCSHFPKQDLCEIANAFAWMML